MNLKIFRKFLATHKKESELRHNMKKQEPIEISPGKFKNALLAVISVIFVLGGILILATGKDIKIAILGIIFFGAAGTMPAYRLLARKPTLIIDDKSLTINTFRHTMKIPWKDITQIEALLHTILGLGGKIPPFIKNHVLAIHVNNPEKYNVSPRRKIITITSLQLDKKKLNVVEILKRYPVKLKVTKI